MLAVERDRLLRQARKAAIIFGRTLGKSHKTPLVELGVDEASAVQLAYAWGELRSLGQNPSLWLSIASRREKPEPVIASTSDASLSSDRDESSSSPETGRLRPKLDSRTRDEKYSSSPELRIACIDIGGGTTDLMIAGYRCHVKVDDQLSGRILHRDGISIAGDQLVKRLLERVIVPVFAHRVGLDAAMTQLLFGPEVPRNRELRSLRTTWMNRIFVPLALRYLDSASSGIATEISHTDPEVVSPEVMASLDRELARLDNSGAWDLSADLQLTVDSTLLADVVHEVLGELLTDFCGRIVEHQADLVLLAGQPTKLGIIQDLVRTLLPLPSSRVIPMHRHYAGNWYPYQDREGRSPGVIVDPKSTVVVGAAIEFLARHGHLPQFRFEMRDELRSQRYYWGVMTDAVSGIRSERVLFQPDENKRRHRFQTSSRRVVIGRRLSSDPRAEAAPVYLLKVDTDDRLAPIDLTVELERSIDKEFGEEQLTVVSVAGTVAGSPAQLGRNVHFSWRTLADEHYYLDSGGLDNIDLG
jgi:hypothetical protein